MKKIIIPVDFSEHSEYALETAAALAKQHNAELIVMHMLELSESVYSSTSSQRSDEATFMLLVANKKFKAFLDKPYLETIHVTPMVKHHKVLKEVSEVAGKLKADLIVMGSRGLSDHAGVFTGSNTEKVVRYSNTPVLVVKSKPKTIDFKSVVLATDFSDKSSSVVKSALELLHKLSKKVILLYVNTPSSDFLNTDEIDEKIASFLKHSKLKSDSITVAKVADYNIEDGVLNYAKRNGAEAIAMITSGRTGLSHLFGGSISEDVVNHTKLPVITFKL